MASRIVGGAKVRRMLKKLPEACRVEIANALDDAIQMVQATAVQLAPVDTGNLRRVLASRGAIGRREKGMRVEFGLRTRAMQRRAFYAPFIEYGTQGYAAGDKRAIARTKDGRIRFRRMRRAVPARGARPFMGPALDINMPRIRVRVNAALRRALTRARRG